MSVEFGDPRLPERFWKKVEPNDTGCWIWKGAIKEQKGGRRYGTYTHDSRQRQVPMVIASVFIQPGYDTKEFRAENTCENKYICAHPEHITLISRHDCKRGHKNPPRANGSCKICKAEDERARPKGRVSQRSRKNVVRRKPTKPIEGFSVFGDKKTDEIWRPSGWPKEVLGGNLKPYESERKSA